MSVLQKHIQKLVERHGSLRAVARVLEVDPGYLSRLHSGEKDEPGEALLHRLRLRRVVTYEPVQPKRVSRTRGVYPPARAAEVQCQGNDCTDEGHGHPTGVKTVDGGRWELRNGDPETGDNGDPTWVPDGVAALPRGELTEEEWRNAADGVDVLDGSQR